MFDVMNVMSAQVRGGQRTIPRCLVFRNMGTGWIFDASTDVPFATTLAPINGLWSMVRTTLAGRWQGRLGKVRHHAGSSINTNNLLYS